MKGQPALNISLASIASEANREHKLATDAACSALEHAVRCGNLLSQVKAKVGHGRFLPWLKANFGGSERTARNYIRLASNRQRVADLGCNSIRTAVEVLTDHSESADWDARLLEISEANAAPFEIPQDHGILLIPPGYRDEDCAIFTPHIDNNFVFFNEYTGESWIGSSKAINRNSAWFAFTTSRLGIDWDHAEIVHIPPGHEWTGPWDYNHCLWDSHDEYIDDILCRRRKAAICDDK